MNDTRKRSKIVHITLKCIVCAHYLVKKAKQHYDCSSTGAVLDRISINY